MDMIIKSVLRSEMWQKFENSIFFKLMVVESFCFIEFGCRQQIFVRAYELSAVHMWHVTAPSRLINPVLV